MSVILSLTDGWTGMLGPFTLKVDGAPISLSGFTVALVLHDPTGALVTPGGTVTVDPDQIGHPGQVSYQPVATDFVYSGSFPYAHQQPYTLHWKVTDLANKVVFFPNGAADFINVYKT